MKTDTQQNTAAMMELTRQINELNTKVAVLTDQMQMNNDRYKGLENKLWGIVVVIITAVIYIILKSSTI